jgi:hypothetical protein
LQQQAMAESEETLVLSTLAEVDRELTAQISQSRECAQAARNKLRFIQTEEIKRSHVDIRAKVDAKRQLAEWSEKLGVLYRGKTIDTITSDELKAAIAEFESAIEWAEDVLDNGDSADTIDAHVNKDSC